MVSPNIPTANAAPAVFLYHIIHMMIPIITAPALLFLIALDAISTISSSEACAISLKLKSHPISALLSIKALYLFTSRRISCIYHTLSISALSTYSSKKVSS